MSVRVLIDGERLIKKQYQFQSTPNINISLVRVQYSTIENHNQAQQQKNKKGKRFSITVYQNQKIIRYSVSLNTYELLKKFTIGSLEDLVECLNGYVAKIMFNGVVINTGNLSKIHILVDFSQFCDQEDERNSAKKSIKGILPQKVIVTDISDQNNINSYTQVQRTQDNILENIYNLCVGVETNLHIKKSYCTFEEFIIEKQRECKQAYFPYSLENCNYFPGIALNLQGLCISILNKRSEEKNSPNKGFEKLLKSRCIEIAIEKEGMIKFKVLINHSRSTFIFWDCDLDISDGKDALLHDIIGTIQYDTKAQQWIILDGYINPVSQTWKPSLQGIWKKMKSRQPYPLEENQSLRIHDTIIKITKETYDLLGKQNHY